MPHTARLKMLAKKKLAGSDQWRPRFPVSAGFRKLGVIAYTRAHVRYKPLVSRNQRKPETKQIVLQNTMITTGIRTSTLAARS